MGVPDTLGVMTRLQLALGVTVAPVPDRELVVGVGRGGVRLTVRCPVQDAERVADGE